jgi:hypothetical protein
METLERGLDDLRVGYRSAVQMASHESEMAWRILSGTAGLTVLLLAVAGAPLVLPRAPDVVRVAAMLLNLAGLLGTIVCAVMVVRARAYHRYWLFSANELERLLNPGVRTFQREPTLARGAIVQVYGAPFQLPWFGRLPAEWGIAAVLVLFGLAHLLVFLAQLSRALAI